jgi:hypothetical protein
VCGFLDVAQKSVVMRDYALVSEQFRKRFGTHFDVAAEEYAALLTQLSGMLETLGFSVTNEAAVEPPSARAGGGAGAAEGESDDEFVLTKSERAKLAWLAGGALVLIALLVLALR